MTNGDPIADWLSSVSSFIPRTLVYGAAVIGGSAIPQFFAGEQPAAILFAFPFQAVWACVLWGSLCWLGWLAAIGIIYYFHHFFRDDTPKRDLFIGFSLSFFLFLSFPNSYLPPLIVYAVLTSLYWRLPKVLYRGNA